MSPVRQYCRSTIFHFTLDDVRLPVAKAGQRWPTLAIDKMRTLGEEYVYWKMHYEPVCPLDEELFLNTWYPIEFIVYLEQRGLYRYYAQLAWTFLFKEKISLEARMRAASINYSILNAQLYQQAARLDTIDKATT